VLSPRNEFRPVVVAPTYNNGGTLEDVMRRARATGLPLIVVNDGSTDETGSILKQGRWAGDPDVTVTHHSRNRGKAAALMTGFTIAAKSGYTHAATIDTDGQLDPGQVPQLVALARANPAALVLGRRDENIDGCPAKNRLGRRLSNLMVWMESGVRVDDSQCGLRVYPLDFVLSTQCPSARYGFEAEIITRAGWAGRAVLETPVRCRYFERGTAVSHFRPWRDSLRGVAMHARLVLRALCTVRRPEGVGDGSMWHTFIQALNPVSAWRQLRGSEVDRTEIAGALAVGAFVANLPAYGFQTILSLYVARRLHLHPLAVVAGSQLSTPPLGPALIAAAVTVGHLLLHGSLPSAADFHATHGVGAFAARFLVEWALGAGVVGLACAVVTFVAANRVLKWAVRGEATAPDAPVAPVSGGAA
jgi:uncharacterized protein (DUF2062 family)